MTKSKHSMGRRQFVQLAALGAVPAACSLTTRRSMATDHDVVMPAESDPPGSENPRGENPRGENKVRVGTTQTNSSPYARGLAIDPFSSQFVAKDLRKSVEGWLKWYQELIERAANDGCKLVVLKEDITRLAHVMTFLDDRALFRDAVQWQTPRVAEQIGDAARRNSIFVVACYFAFEKGAIYNVADLFGPNGDLVGRYRKVHLPEYELWQVKPGDAFPAFETDLGWISMLICYDQMWPESASCCAMNGAQLICQPSAASLADYHMRTRANDNQLHFISSTWKNSMIVSPRAEILADAKQKDPAVVWADVDLGNATKPADQWYWEQLYSGIGDHKERQLKFRRPDAYGVLVEEQPPLAQQYPDGGVANTPESIERVYAIHKAMMQDRINGKPVPYHWNP